MTTSGSRTSSRSTSRVGPVMTAVAALVVIAIGIWSYTALRAALRTQATHDLNAVIDTHTQLLRMWVEHRAEDGGALDVGELARELPAPQIGATGEVLVVSSNGALLTTSRFASELGELGLPVDEVLELRDPGGDLTTGFRPEVARRLLPLTRLAGLLASERDGQDLAGYRSYRGVEVVGAWRWLDDLGVGIGAEMSATQAYGPARVLLRALWGLVALVLVAAAAGIIAARRNAVLLRKVREAESKARKFGQYTLVHKIGEGGMGEVYRAKHAMLRRPTAIKLLRPDRTSEDAIARFEREVQQTSRLTHPNTVQIYDFGRTPGGTFYFAMEYLVGITLDRFIENHGPLPEGRVLFILQQVCASLNEAHGLGLVHRDIKPENIALCQAGGAFDVVKVLDFGLVVDRASKDRTKLSQTGAILGTPMYMAPEAFLRPETVDARSDLYSLAAVGYFLLTGRPPFEGQSVMELFNQQTKQKPEAPSAVCDQPILPDVDAALLACLEKDPGRRPESANALSRELQWCRSFGEWNRDKARYWWQEHEERLEALYGLTSKAQLSPSDGQETIQIDIGGR